MEGATQLFTYLRGETLVALQMLVGIPKPFNPAKMSNGVRQLREENIFSIPAPRERGSPMGFSLASPSKQMC